MEEEKTLFTRSSFSYATGAMAGSSTTFGMFGHAARTAGMAVAGSNPYTIGAALACGVLVGVVAQKFTYDNNPCQYTDQTAQNTVE